MDDDVVEAIIAQLRTISGITALVTTRIYPAAQVPPDQPFPRGMVGIADGGVDEWSDGGLCLVRWPMFTVEWCSRPLESPTANKDIQTLDRLTHAALRGTIVVSNLDYLRRAHTLRPLTEYDDDVEYISGGGLWMGRREYHYNS